MSRAAYNRQVCWICSQEHSVNGLAHTNHMRKHVREGVLSEYQDTGPYGTLEFERIKPGADMRVFVDGVFQERMTTPPTEIAKHFNARIKTIKRFKGFIGEWAYRLELESIPNPKSAVD